jgi:hypothetical protein
MTEHAIATLRDQLAGLLSQIDASHKPRPTSVVRDGERLPGPRWEPTKRWKLWVFTDEEDLNRSFVYVTTPQHHELEAPNDFDALPTHEARKLAMALLAAADWADGLAAGVPQLDQHRNLQEMR